MSTKDPIYPQLYEKYYGSGSTITPITTPETSDSPTYTGLVAGLVITVCVALLAIGVAICRCCYRRKRKANIDSHRTNQGNGNTGPSTNIDLHRVNQGTASGGPPSLGELAQNEAADPVVLPTSRPGDFGMSQDPTPMNPVSTLRESRGLIQNPVQASSEPPSDIPGSGIPILYLQVYGAFPPEVADRWDDLSLHSDQELNLNLVSDEEDRDPLSGDPGSLQLDLRSGIEYAPEPQAADNMDHWVVVEQMSGTGGVSTGAVLRGCERIEEHAIQMSTKGPIYPHKDGKTLEEDAEVNGETIQYPTSTGGETNKLLSDSNPDHTNNASHILREKPNGMTVAAHICGSNTENTSNRLSSMMSLLSELNIPRNQGNGDNRPSAMMEMHRNQGNGNTGASANIDSHRMNQGNGNTGPSTNIDSHRTNQGGGNTGPSTNIDSHRTNQGNGNTGPSANIDSYRTNQGNGNTGPSTNIDSHRTNQGNGNTGPSANIDSHRTNQGTAHGGRLSLRELASDHIVLPTSRSGDIGMSQDPTPMNLVSSLRESRGLIQKPVQATSETPSDIPGSGIPSLHLQVYEAFPPEVADRWDDLSLHSDQEGNLNLVSDEEDLDPLSGDPGSLQLDLRSGLEYVPDPQAADNMDHWVVVEQMSGTGGVSTGAVLHGWEMVEDHAIYMPWVRGCFKTGHKLGIYTERGERSEEAMRQQALDVTGLPRQALVLSRPAPDPGPYPPQESIDSLFGDSGPA